MKGFLLGVMVGVGVMASGAWATHKTAIVEPICVNGCEGTSLTDVWVETVPTPIALCHYRDKKTGLLMAIER